MEAEAEVAHFCLFVFNSKLPPEDNIIRLLLLPTKDVVKREMFTDILAKEWDSVMEDTRTNEPNHLDLQLKLPPALPHHHYHNSYILEANKHIHYRIGCCWLHSYT